MNKQDKKQSEAAPVTKVDPKRAVQTIDVAQLEDVIGGMDEGGSYPLRMATEE